MKHTMNLNPAPFENIKAGSKTVEMRLYDDKRRKIKAGDEIEFTNTQTGQSLNMQVKAMCVFKNFSELYSAYSPREIGYADGETALPSDMNAYYSVDNEEKYGVVAIELLPCLHP